MSKEKITGTHVMEITLSNQHSFQTKVHVSVSDIHNFIVYDRVFYCKISSGISIGIVISNIANMMIGETRYGAYAVKPKDVVVSGGNKYPAEIVKMFNHKLHEKLGKCFSPIRSKARSSRELLAIFCFAKSFSFRGFREIFCISRRFTRT